MLSDLAMRSKSDIISRTRGADEVGKDGGHENVDGVQVEEGAGEDGLLGAADNPIGTPNR